MENRFEFSKTSKSRLRTCHPDLKLIMECALAFSEIDFGIAEGHRSVERQKKLFAEGKSQLDGVRKKSKHNLKPSMAVDIYAWVDGEASWEPEHLSRIAKTVKFVAVQLGGKVSHSLRWGGDWQSFVDMPHFELV